MSGTRKKLRVGTAVAEVQLEKTSGKPREAQHDVRWMVDGAWEDELVQTTSAVKAVADVRRSMSDDVFGATTAEVESAHGGSWPHEAEDHTATAPEREARHGAWRNGGERAEFVDLTDKLARVDEVSLIDGVQIVATVDRAQVPRMRVRDSYYVVPAGEGAVALLEHLFIGLVDTGTVAVVRWTKSTNQALGVLVPMTLRGDRALVVLELEWQAAMRDLPSGAILFPWRVPQSGREAAAQAMGALRRKTDVFGELEDERQARRQALLTAARSGVDLPDVEPEEIEQGDDPLAQALAAVR